MPRVVFETSGGEAITVDAALGETAMRAAVAGSVPGIEGACGGACSCATCHVHVAPEWMEAVGPAGEMEAEMIEFDSDYQPCSRLCCQIVMTGELDGLRLKVVND